MLETWVTGALGAAIIASATRTTAGSEKSCAQQRDGDFRQVQKSHVFPQVTLMP
jgi:hypothetical protein